MLAVVLLLGLTAACGSTDDGTDVVANAAMPGYLDQFLADDGILMVPQLRHEADAADSVDPSFAGDVRATYLYVMIETLVGRPFVDEGLAAKIDAYAPSRTASVQGWEKALNQRLSERLRGRVAIPDKAGPAWIPELGGQGGRYLPDMALLCRDLDVAPGLLTALDLDGAGPRAHAAVGNWVITGKAPEFTAADLTGWRMIVRDGPADNYRQYLIAGTALLLTVPESERSEVVAEVGERLDADRGVDGVPWMVPEAKGAAGGDLLAGLAGIYFDLVATSTSVGDVLQGRAEYTTYLGTHL